MDTKYRLLKIDYWIQIIIGSAILFCCATVVGLYFSALGLIPLGTMQVISGLIFSIGYRDRKRIVYLVIVAAFFSCWYAVANVSYDSQYYDSTRFVNYILLVIPPSLGIWYFKQTSKEYHALKKQRVISDLHDTAILDA